jgi:branched-chain amino acid transport system permease protein
VLGGMGSIIGSFLASMIICQLGSIGALYMPEGFKEVLVFAIFILIIIIRPQGLLGEKER